VGGWVAGGLACIWVSAAAARASMIKSVSDVEGGGGGAGGGGKKGEKAGTAIWCWFASSPPKLHPRLKGSPRVCGSLRTEHS